MREKIKARIKAKFPNANLRQKRLNEILDRLEPLITDENNIDAELDAFNKYTPFESIAKADDTIADLSTKLKAAETKNDGKTGTESSDDDKKSSADDKDNPVLKALAGIQSELASLKAEKLQSTIKDRVMNHEKLKGKIPESFYKRWQLPDSEDKIDQFVADVETEWTTLQQDTNNEQLSSQPKPIFTPSGSSKTLADDKVSAEYEAYRAQQKANAAALNGTSAAPAAK